LSNLRRPSPLRCLHLLILKTLARNSLEYSFLPGDSLWASASPYVLSAPCAAAAPAASQPPAACQTLLASSDKAREQWRLEGDLAALEGSIRTGDARAEPVASAPPR